MKRNELLNRISKLAKDTNSEWRFLREGSNHSIWTFNEVKIAIPRHVKINEITALGILKECTRLSEAKGDKDDKN